MRYAHFTYTSLAYKHTYTHKHQIIFAYFFFCVHQFIVSGSQMPHRFTVVRKSFDGDTSAHGEGRGTEMKTIQKNAI